MQSQQFEIRQTESHDRALPVPVEIEALRYIRRVRLDLESQLTHFFC